jgi:hypothetical protein
MSYLVNFWNKIKHQPDIWFFYIFLLTFTFSVRKIIDYYPIQGTKERAFNEYSSIFIYISDIFLFFTILSWLYIILSNNKVNVSRLKLWITSCIHRLYSKVEVELKFLFVSVPGFKRNKHRDKLFHVEQLNEFLAISFKNISLILIPLLLVVWSFVSIIWSQNQTIAFFISIKILEYYLLYLYIVFRIVPRNKHNCSTLAPLHPNVPYGTFGCFTGWNNIMIIIIFTGLFHSLIGIIQFLIQHSIGIFLLKESLISPDIAGVAKFIINGHKYIRSYGLFPHPNILAGFLLFSIITTLLYKKMFHVEHFMRNGTILNILILIQILALLFTFSKSAIIGLAIALFYIYVPRLTRRTKMFHPVKAIDVPCETSMANGASTEHSLLGETFLTNLRHNRNSRIIFLTFLIIFMISYLSWPTLSLMLHNSIQQRMLYFNVSRGTIIANPLLGVGIGQFILNMPRYVNNPELWQFQPVHNVFFLIWSELGMVGLVLFIYWLYRMFHPISKNRGIIGVDKSILENKSYYLSNDRLLPYFKAILIGFLFIMLFDHYFWDIQQGSVMLWMILGFIAGLNNQKNNN